MEASSWLLDARTMKQKIRKHEAWSGDKRVDSGEKSLWWPTLQPTSVPPHGCEATGLHKVAGFRRPSGGMLVLCLYGKLLLESQDQNFNNMDH